MTTIAELIERHKIEVEITGTGTARDDRGWDHNVFEVSINGRKMPVNFRAGMAATVDEEMVLGAYSRDAYSADMTYPDWCGELGMENTNEVLAMWESCAEIKALLIEAVGADTLAELIEADW